MPKSLKPGQYPALMELALERIGIVLWERGLADGIVETSSNYNAFYEVPADSTDDTFGDVLLRFHPDDREVLLTAQAALIARGEPYRPVCRVARPDGTYRWIQVEGVLTRDAAGVPLKMAGISWDVTALQESEARLHSVADLVPGVLFEVVRDVDNHLSLSFISQAGESLYGFPRAELMADFRKTLCRIHPDDKKRVSDSFIATADGQSVWEAEYRLVMPSGETRWLEGRAKARPVLQGRTIWCGHIVDITARRYEQEAFGLLNLQLQAAQKQELIGLMAAGISHDFSNLLSNIVGYTELGQLALRQGTPERLHPYLTAIQDTSERGRDLIEELLAFAGTTPDAQPNPSPQSLAALTQATLNTTFSICFPVEGSASTTGEGEVGLAVSAPKRIRILVIDDEPEVAHFLVPLMEADAYDVSFKQDPTEALALLLADKTRCPFELVLTDQTMPGLTGMELARALLTVFPALPVVMVSGNSPATLAAARELPNIRDIVRKPFRYQELKTVLDAVLG